MTHIASGHRHSQGQSDGGDLGIRLPNDTAYGASSGGDDGVSISRGAVEGQNTTSEINLQQIFNLYLAGQSSAIPTLRHNGNPVAQFYLGDGRNVSFLYGLTTPPVEDFQLGRSSTSSDATLVSRIIAIVSIIPEDKLDGLAGIPRRQDHFLDAQTAGTVRGWPEPSFWAAATPSGCSVQSSGCRAPLPPWCSHWRALGCATRQRPVASSSSIVIRTMARARHLRPQYQRLSPTSSLKIHRIGSPELRGGTTTSTIPKSLNSSWMAVPKCLGCGSTPGLSNAMRRISAPLLQWNTRCQRPARATAPPFLRQGRPSLCSPPHHLRPRHWPILARRAVGLFVALGSPVGQSLPSGRLVAVVGCGHFCWSLPTLKFRRLGSATA